MMGLYLMASHSLPVRSHLAPGPTGKWCLYIDSLHALVYLHFLSELLFQ